MKLSKLALATGAAAALSVSGLPKPAAAQSQGTINTLLGAAAVVGGIILYNNYVHKKQAANHVVGYTRNGGTVYGDGRIVFANGQTIYPNSNGQYSNGQYAYWNGNADPGNYQYDPQRTGRWDATHRHGQYANNGYYQNNGNYQYNANHQNRDRHDNGRHMGDERRRHHDDNDDRDH